MKKTLFLYLINDPDLLNQMTRRIDELHKAGHYNGGYEAVKLAVKGK